MFSLKHLNTKTLKHTSRKTNKFIIHKENTCLIIIKPQILTPCFLKAFVGHTVEWYRRLWSSYSYSKHFIQRKICNLVQLLTFIWPKDNMKSWWIVMQINEIFCNIMAQYLHKMSVNIRCHSISLNNNLSKMFKCLVLDVQINVFKILMDHILHYLNFNMIFQKKNVWINKKT